MKAGEYIGADGWTYRWLKTPQRSPEGYRHEVASPDWHAPHDINPADWPAAKAALDALIESGAGEWVEFDWRTKDDQYHADNYLRRCRPDGSEPQTACNYEVGGPKWMPDNSRDNPMWVAAYRKGRSVALEQVQELVGFIERAPIWVGTERYAEWPTAKWAWDEIKRLAKAVKDARP